MFKKDVEATSTIILWVFFLITHPLRRQFFLKMAIAIEEEEFI